MYWMIKSQFICCIETLWTFTANIRFHSYMSLSVYFIVICSGEFLLTNITRAPSTFNVWLQLTTAAHRAHDQWFIWYFTIPGWAQIPAAKHDRYCQTVTVSTSNKSIQWKLFPECRTVLPSPANATHTGWSMVYVFLSVLVSLILFVWSLVRPPSVTPWGLIKRCCLFLY